MLSNKTYFLEEMSKHKLIAKDAKKESIIYKQKIEMLEIKNRELEDQIHHMLENVEQYKTTKGQGTKDKSREDTKSVESISFKNLTTKIVKNPIYSNHANS